MNRPGHTLRYYPPMPRSPTLRRDATMARIWIHKRALSEGIRRVDAALITPDGWARTNTRFFPPSEFSRTLEEAMDKAEKMRLNRIRSLRAQLERLESLTTHVQEGPQQ